MSNFIFDIFDDDMSLTDILNISFNEIFQQPGLSMEPRVEQYSLHQNVVSRMVDVRQNLERFLEQRNFSQSPPPLLSSQFFSIFSSGDEVYSDGVHEDVAITVKPKDFDEFLHTQVTLDNCESYGNMECNVCLSSYSVGDKATELPCGHTFHCICIKKWLCDKSSKCPICRNDCRPE
jgi:hypothetical protein